MPTKLPISAAFAAATIEARLREMQRKLSEIAEIPKILSSTLATVSQTFDKLMPSDEHCWQHQPMTGCACRKWSYDEDAIDYELNTLNEQDDEEDVTPEDAEYETSMSKRGGNNGNDAVGDNDDDEDEDEDEEDDELQAELNVNLAFAQRLLEKNLKDVTPESDYASEANDDDDDDETASVYSSAAEEEQEREQKREWQQKKKEVRKVEQEWYKLKQHEDGQEENEELVEEQLEEDQKKLGWDAVERKEPERDIEEQKELEQDVEEEKEPQEITKEQKQRELLGQEDENDEEQRKLEQFIVEKEEEQVGEMQKVSVGDREGTIKQEKYTKEEVELENFSKEQEKKWQQEETKWDDEERQNQQHLIGSDEDISEFDSFSSETVYYLKLPTAATNNIHGTDDGNETDYDNDDDDDNDIGNEQEQDNDFLSTTYTWNIPKLRLNGIEHDDVCDLTLNAQANAMNQIQPTDNERCVDQFDSGNMNDNDDVGDDDAVTPQIAPQAVTNKPHSAVFDNDSSSSSSSSSNKQQLTLTPQKVLFRLDNLERAWPWADREKIIYKQSTCHLVPRKPMGLVEQRKQLLTKQNILNKLEQAMGK